MRPTQRSARAGAKPTDHKTDHKNYMAKTCRKCGVSSEEAEFKKDRRFCKECWRIEHRRRMRKYRESNAEDVKSKRLQRRYGITLEDYEEMIEEQDHSCAVCGRERELVVDHCHISDEVRGLLCKPCNTAIGSLEDDPRIIYSAVRYVIEHSGLRLEEEE